MIYVLDACAMIALLLQENGEEVVWAHLLEKDATCLAHSINLCEVFYDFYRDSGEVAALRGYRTLGGSELLNEAILMKNSGGRSALLKAFTAGFRSLIAARSLSLSALGESF